MELKQIGRYEIQRRLGKGGMGSLYLARDPGLDRLVAIKLLKDDYLEDEEFRERFSREARALARLRHPNIVVVFDFGQHEGRPFMAMEYIDGETLRQRLARTPPMKLALGLAIAEDLCAGLASAHDAGIVHRDIKPDNIMMDRQGVLKLLDFGIARHAHSESTHQMTQPGMIMGTYNYMSPEQLLGEMVDKRSDIFAVGAVLYQVIAREQAFPGAFGAVYHRVLTTGPVPLEERVPGVDAGLVRIVMRALERNPQDRYQSADDMRQELSRTRQRLAERGANEVQETIVLPRTPSSRRQKDSEAKRGLVAEQLRLSHEAFERGDHDIALQYGERAAFVDPDNETAHELINKSRVAIDTKSILPLLQEAERLLSKNLLDEALTKAEEASAGVPDLPEAEDLRKQVRAVFDRIVKAREREGRINSSLERARDSFDRGEYETALRAVYEVLALDPDRHQARELEQRAKVQLKAQREFEQARRDAYDRLGAAQALANAGQHDEAAAALDAIASPSDTVRAAVAEAVAAVARLKRQAQTEAAVAEAEAAAAEGDFTRAVSIIDVIPSEDLTESAHRVRTDALEELARQRELEQKQKRFEQLVAAADASINAGDVTHAGGTLAEAAELDLHDQRLDALRQRLDETIERVEGERHKQALDREAAASIQSARQLFATDPQAAVALLERSDLTHPDVASALRELRGSLAQIEERARKEREQAEAARRAAEAEAARVREQQRAAAERQRLEEEARLREQQRIIEEERQAEADRQSEEARQQEEQFDQTVVRPTEATVVLPTVVVERSAGRDVSRQQDSKRGIATEVSKQPEPIQQQHAGSWSWQSLSAKARAGIVLLALVSVGIGVGAYRFFTDPSSTTTTVDSGPALPTGATNVENPGPPVESEKPVEVPTQPAPEVTGAESLGTVVLDALPWAEVVSIVDDKGNRQEIPANSFTPLTLTLPSGVYEVTFRNGSTRTSKIQITSDRVTTMDPIDFGKVDAAEYLQRQGWQ